MRATKTTRWAREGQVIGFARATSDRALFGTIWDVAVIPAPLLPNNVPAAARLQSKHACRLPRSRAVAEPGRRRACAACEPVLNGSGLRRRRLPAPFLPLPQL